MRDKLFITLILLFLPFPCFSQTISDYLILQDIGLYKLDKPEAVFPKEPPIGGPHAYDGPGMIGATGHFPDHKDLTYEVMYIGGGGLPSPRVQVTQHAGSDSDKWLSHEVERGFRRGNFEEDMAPARFRNIDGNNIFYSGLGGGTYRWLSNYIVVSIEYVDLYRHKSEPIEVVKAYLTKFPSTIPSMAIDRVHNEQWIKDEMERRLWLCDKWFLHLQLGKAAQDEALREIVDQMEVFLDYREKYYGISGKSEKSALSGYLTANDGTAIKNKLTAYKTWWSVNKTKAINLP